MKNVSTRDMNLGIVVEAKIQYTKQLINVMKPIIYERLFDMYSDSIEKCERKEDLLICFQRELQQVPKWNSDVIKEATHKIVDSCAYFNDLITAVFLSNVRILTSVKMNSKKRKVKLVVPTNETFVHKVYVNVSKNIYNDPFTFSNKRYGGDVLRNMNDVFPLIETSIEDTVRDMLPIQNILESYLGDTMSDDEEDPDYPPMMEENGDAEIPEDEPENLSDADPDPDNDPDTDNDPDVNAAVEVPDSEEPKPADTGFFARPSRDEAEEPVEIKEIPLGGAGQQQHPSSLAHEHRERVSKKTFFDDVDD